MAYTQTIETTKYPNSSYTTSYGQFYLKLTCDTLASQTGYIDLNYEFQYYTKSSGNYHGSPGYSASAVSLTINGDVLFSGVGPYGSSSAFTGSTTTLKTGTFRAFLDENGVCQFDLSISAKLTPFSGSTSVYNYSYTKTPQKLDTPGGTLTYPDSKSKYYNADAYATWTLVSQDVASNSSKIKLTLVKRIDETQRDYNYYAKITPLSSGGRYCTVTVKGTASAYTSDTATFDFPHPTDGRTPARFRMEVGATATTPQPGYGGYYPSQTDISPAITGEFLLPKIFRNVADVYVGTEFKSLRVYVYHNGVWKRAQPNVFTDGSYVST